MEDYSRMKSITVTNFMSHKHTRVEFDESNIIDLCGYNDSGKTAIEYALDVLFYDGSPMLQSSYIKEGETFFKVEVEFDDGVKISKTKDENGKSIWVMEKENTIIYTNKKETEIIATDGVPQIITKYLGVVYDEATKQKLNLRTKRDKALLTETSGGENYKMLSMVCNSEILSTASKAMTDKKNKLNQEIATKSTELAAYQNQYYSIDTPPEMVLDALAEKTEKARAVQNKSNLMASVKGSVDTLNSLVVQPELDSSAVKAKEEQLRVLQGVVECNSKLNTSIYPEVQPLNCSKLSVISECVRLNSILQNSGVYPESKEYKGTKLRDIVEVVKQYNAYNSDYTVYMQTEEKYKACVQELTALCSANNIRICKNCGTAVVEEGTHEHV